MGAGMKGRHREGIRRGDGETGLQRFAESRNILSSFSRSKVQISSSGARGEEMRI